MSRLPYDRGRYDFFVMQVLQKVMAVWDHSDITVGKAKKELLVRSSHIAFVLQISQEYGY